MLRHENASPSPWGGLPGRRETPMRRHGSGYAVAGPSLFVWEESRQEAEGWLEVARFAEALPPGRCRVPITRAADQRTPATRRKPTPRAAQPLISGNVQAKRSEGTRPR
jgi:hypothetical protein